MLSVLLHVSSVACVQSACPRQLPGHTHLDPRCHYCLRGAQLATSIQKIEDGIQNIQSDLKSVESDVKSVDTRLRNVENTVNTSQVGLAQPPPPPLAQPVTVPVHVLVVPV